VRTRDNKTVFEIRSSVPGTRELAISETPFVIPYRVRGNVLEALWPAAGSADTELNRRWIMERRKFTREFKVEAVKLIKDRGVSYVQAAEDLRVHQSVLRTWVKAFAADPQQTFHGHGQMSPSRLKSCGLSRSDQAEGRA
jgi:transposase